MVKGFLEKGHPLYCDETTQLIIPRSQKLLEKEIARDLKILSLCYFHDPDESFSIAREMEGRLGGVRLDTPYEGWGVTADLVRETRARLDLVGYKDVKIFISGGITPERIKHFIEKRALVDAFGVGSFISGARPIDLTADLHEIKGKPVAKRGRVL